MASLAPVPNSPLPLPSPSLSPAGPPPSSSASPSVRPPSKQSLPLHSLSPTSPPQFLPHHILLPPSLLLPTARGPRRRQPTQPDEDPPPFTSTSTAVTLASPSSSSLNVDDRKQMMELMSLKCSEEHYLMASEVIGIIVPAVSSSSDASIEQKLEASNGQAKRLAKSLARWCNLSQRPLCTLISTIVLLERLFALHPKFNESAISSDTFLRLSFSSFLLALKTTNDGSFRNSTFVRHTPWSLADINVMERELLGAARYDLYVSPIEFLHRANGFWTQHLREIGSSTRLPSPPSAPSRNLLLLTDASNPTSLSLAPSPSPPSIGNLFLTQRRSGVEERGWKGGILHSPGKTGRRMNDDVEEETVWKEGRLERTEGWKRSRSGSVVPKKKKGEKLLMSAAGGILKAPPRRESI